MDLTIGVTASKRRPATFSQSSFSRTSNLFFCFSPPLWNVIVNLFVPVSTMFLSIFNGLWSNDSVNFLSKAGAFQFCAFRRDPLLILPRRTLNQIYSMKRTRRCNISHSHSSSSFHAINPVFPYRSYKLSHLRCYAQSLI